MSEALLELDAECARRTGGHEALRSLRIGAGVIAWAAREYFDRKLRMRVREVGDVGGKFPAIVDGCESHIDFAISRQLIPRVDRCIGIAEIALSHVGVIDTGRRRPFRSRLKRIDEAGGHLPLRIAFQRSTYGAG